MESGPEMYNLCRSADIEVGGDVKKITNTGQAQAGRRVLVSLCYQKIKKYKNDKK